MPRIVTAVPIGFVLCAVPCRATILYSVDAGWLFPGGSALIDYVHRLNGHTARRKLGTVRQALVATGQPIETDLGSLKRAVTCPADAPASD